MPGSSTFGASRYSETVISDAVEDAPIIDNPNSNINPRIQTGFFTLGQRGYSRPEIYTPRIADAGDSNVPGITISNVAGAFVGKIRTDIQFSILQSMKFTLIDGLDCADFTMKLNRLPGFPIPRFSVIEFQIIGRASKGKWYKGVIEDVPDVGTQRSEFTYKGNGFRQYANTVSGNLDVLAGTGRDVGQVFYELVETILAKQTPIVLNPSKINTTTGVIVVNDLEFGKYKLSKIFDTLAAMGNQIWGVDGDGDIYFIDAPGENDAPIKTFFVGYNIQKFLPKLNMKAVRNSINVLRQQGKGTGGAGWKVGGIFNDDSSIGKYRTRKLDFQVPGFFGQEEIDIIGNALLSEKSEPKFSAVMDGFRIRSGADFMETGIYRFILPFDSYPLIYSDVDDASEWIKTGGGDLTVSDESGTGFFVWADGSVKLNYTNALNDTIVFTGAFKGAVNKIRMFVRSNRRGQFLTMGVGKTTAFENSTKIDFPLVNQFYNFEWDVSNLSIPEINKIGLRVDESGPVSSTDIYIDQIEFEVVGHAFYKMPNKKVIYTFAPNNITARAEMGVLPPRIENYLKSLFSTASELKFTQEVV